MYLQYLYCSGCVLCMLWLVLVTTFYWDSVIDFYHGIPVVSMANCISGLYSPGLCLVFSLFSWWNLWMKSCLYGINSRGSLNGLTSFIISSIVPYSCLLLCRMCCAKADCGLLFLMYFTCSGISCLGPDLSVLCICGYMFYKLVHRFPCICILVFCFSFLRWSAVVNCYCF